MTPTAQSTPDVLIVGAGLAGLACARHLQSNGVPFRILEASDAVGGRIRTDQIAGFLLDRGFQVFHTAYPEARRVLDYAALDLRRFYPGAVIRTHNHSYHIADPVRKPLDALESLFAPYGTTRDKLRILLLREQLRFRSIQTIFQRQELTALEALHRAGFSPAIVSSFFRPFLRGIFLEKGLQTSSRMFEFVMKMFIEGHVTLPAMGMEAIPAQLATLLPQERIMLQTKVHAVSPAQVTLQSGEEMTARAVVVATEGPMAARLIPGLGVPPSCGITCMYFVAEYDPIGGPILVLSGDAAGPINNLCVPSSVAPSYAPAGASLISVTLLGNPEEDDKHIEAAVRSQLTSWFGQRVSAWRFLRMYHIHHALPSQGVPSLSQPERPVRVQKGLYVCGDHRDNATIHGALVSGRRAAEAVLDDLKS